MPDGLGKRQGVADAGAPTRASPSRGKKIDGLEWQQLAVGNVERREVLYPQFDETVKVDEEDVRIVVEL